MAGKGNDERQVKRIKIKHYDRFHAIVKLPQHLGIGAVLKNRADSKGTVVVFIKEIKLCGTALPVRRNARWVSR